MSWSQPPDPQTPPQGSPPSGSSDPNWVQVPPDQWPGSTPNTPPQASRQPQPQVVIGGSTLYQSPYPVIAPKRQGCGLGCIISLFIVGIIAVSIFGVFAAMGSFAGGDFLSQISEIVNTVTNIDAALGLSTTTLPGDADAYDSIAALAAVTAFAGEGAQLVELEAAQVRSDGTQNLNATYDPPRPRTTYTFLREVPRPENAPPVGAGGTADGQWYEPITVEAYRPGQMSYITQMGGSVNIQTQFVNQGLKREVDDPTSELFFYNDGAFVAAPKCSTRQLWSTALERGAPADAVASITYNDEGYEFRIIGAGFSLNFDANCRVRA